jgi:hypothetical protein
VSDRSAASADLAGAGSAAEDLAEVADSEAGSVDLAAAAAAAVAAAAVGNGREKLGIKN